MFYLVFLDFIIILFFDIPTFFLNDHMIKLSLQISRLHKEEDKWFQESGIILISN